MSRVLGVLAAVLAVMGCSRPEPALVHDLVEEAVVADYTAPWELILFGTPGAQQHEGRGFVFAASAGPGHVYRWVEPRTRVVLTLEEPAPRVVLLEMAPHPELGELSAAVSLNGEPVGELRLEPRRRWYRLGLPAAGQQPGKNQIELRFSDGTAPVKPHRKRLSAALFSLALGEPDDASLSDLLADGAPTALGPTGGEDSAGLGQVGPSGVEFVFRSPRDAELRFTPDLHDVPSKAGGSLGLRVTLQSEADGEPRTLWSQVVSADQVPEEISVSLGTRPGVLVRLGLHVDSGPGTRFAWAIWRQPRVVGATEEDPAESRAGPEREVQKLRSALEGSNVLLLILDAARAGNLGCYGYHRPTTPEIDRIAAEGVVFERAFTTNVFTLLAMSSLWTSQHPDRHHNGVPYNARLPKHHLTLSELLGAQGIHSAGFISNAIAGTAFALDRGFGEFHEIFRDHGGRADAYAQVLPQWLEAHRQRRFFLYLHVREPHFPYNPVEPFDTQFGPEGPITLEQRGNLDFFEEINSGRRPFSEEEREHLGRLYDGALAYADREVGHLRQTMERLGLWERTVVIVTSDHGEALYEHGHVGHIKQLYEESLQVPLIVRFPAGKGPAGQRLDPMVSIIDLAPTIADVFGVQGKGGSSEQFQGTSLLSAALGAAGRAEVFARSSYDQPRYALREGRFKYIYNTANGQEELYQIEADPGERNNLATREPLGTALRRQRLFSWILEQRRGEASGGEGAELTPEQLENLRALGYVN